jgi:uncharacterized protein (DUF1778 family)
MTTILRTEKLDLRLSPQAKQRVVVAAEAESRTVSECALQSALQRADETLAMRLALLPKARRSRISVNRDGPQNPTERKRSEIATLF